MFSRVFKSVALTVSFVLVFQPLATSAALAIEESSITAASTEQSGQTVQPDYTKRHLVYGQFLLSLVLLEQRLRHLGG